MKGNYYTMEEIKRLNVIQSVIDKKRAQKEAHQLLNITDRQIRKIIVKIKTIEQANKFLIKYIEKYNKKFAVLPANSDTSFMPIPKYVNLDLLLVSQ